MSSRLYTEIPREFHSASTGQLFDQCIKCDAYLLDGKKEYLIEKAIKNYPGYKAQDTLFDYAICMECAQGIHSKLSKESLESIQHYFAKNINFEKRAVALDSDSFTQNCLIKGVSKEDSSEFQLYAHCKGNQLFLGNPPYMISGEVMEEVMEILSKETKDELGGFFEKHFSPDPDLFQTDPTRKIILI